MNEILLECRKITKNFGQTHALTDVDIVFRRGEIHGLIGENGSGKSTLTSIISGLIPPTSGEMVLEGKPWKPQSSLAGYKNGVRIVVQEASTVPAVTVAENIFMGDETLFAKGPFINRAKLNAAAKSALDGIGVTNILPNAPTWSLDMESRKLVELARAAYGKVDIFIIDETSTALSHNGRMIMYNVMHRLADEGTAVILISHDLAEIQEHCSLITVLRDGQRIGSLKKEEFSDNAIKQMMIGRKIDAEYYRSDEDGYFEQVVLRAENITTLHEIENFSIELHKGEILGIGGLSECGMHTLGKALYGFEPVIRGRVVNEERGGVVITNSEVAMKSGMAYVSKNRDTESLALNAPIRENIQVTGYDENRLFANVISYRKERKYVQDMIKALSIKCNSMDDEVKSLSGGNKQKVVFGKWVAKNSDILILDCPTRGVDIGVKAAMYSLIHRMKQEGKSILMISEELPELIGMCDRLLIMKDGVVANEYLRKNHPTESQLIEAMI